MATATQDRLINVELMGSLMVAIDASFAGRKFLTGNRGEDKVRCAAYLERVKGLPADTVATAVEEACNDSGHPPSAGDIRQRALRIQSDQRRDRRGDALSEKQDQWKSQLDALPGDVPGYPQRDDFASFEEWQGALAEHAGGERTDLNHSGEPEYVTDKNGVKYFVVDQSTGHYMLEGGMLGALAPGFEHCKNRVRQPEQKRKTPNNLTHRQKQRKAEFAKKRAEKESHDGRNDDQSDETQQLQKDGQESSTSASHRGANQQGDVVA